MVVVVAAEVVVVVGDVVVVVVAAAVVVVADAIVVVTFTGGFPPGLPTSVPPQPEMKRMTSTLTTPFRDFNTG